MNPRPRILIIENSVDITGALKSISAMVKELSGDFEFVFIIPLGSRAAKWIATQMSVRVYQLPMIEIGRSLRSISLYFPFLLLNAIRVQKILRREQIDIVHCNDLYNLIPPLLKFFGFKFGYVCHIRFLRSAFPRRLFDFWLTCQLTAASTVFVVSDFLRRQLPDHPKIVTMHDRILTEHDAFPPVVPSTNRLLYLSNLIPGKGHDTAISAFKLVHNKFPEWTLRFVGSDMGLRKNQRYLEQLRQESRDIDDSIEWKGLTDDVMTEYKESCIVLNFSRAESFSMTCLEAQYYGRAVVAACSGGPEEIIEDGLTGILVSIDDVEAAAAAIAKLIENADLRDRMGRTAAEHMRVKFSRSATTAVLDKIYHELNDSRNRSSQ